MGNCLSEHMDPRRWFSGDVQRDATGLTAAEKKAVRDVWQAYRRDHEEDYGVCVFQAFLLKYPDYLNLFKEFQGKTMRALTSDPQFRLHCTRVGDELAALIDALDTPTELLQQIEQNADRHHKFKNVKPTHFRQFGQVIVDMLGASYEAHMTPRALSGWQNFFETLVRVTNIVYENAKFSSSTSDGYKTATLSLANVAFATTEETAATGGKTGASGAPPGGQRSSDSSKGSSQGSHNHGSGTDHSEESGRRASADAATRQRKRSIAPVPESAAGTSGAATLPTRRHSSGSLRKDPPDTASLRGSSHPAAKTSSKKSNPAAAAADAASRPAPKESDTAGKKSAPGKTNENAAASSSKGKDSDRRKSVSEKSRSQPEDNKANKALPETLGLDKTNASDGKTKTKTGGVVAAKPTHQPTKPSKEPKP